MTDAWPIDPMLPHLALALDGGAMQRHFTSHGGLAPGWSVRECRVERVKYRPRRNLSVAYRLELRHVRRGLRHDQFVATRWCADGESLARFAKAQGRPQLATPAGPTVMHDAALDVVAHWWPNDARLAAAAALGDGRRMHTQWLPEVARMLAAPSATLVQSQLELVQLVPEHRVTARALLRLADGSEHLVYAKGDAAQGGPVTQAAMQALWDDPARRRGTLHVPQPLGWQPGSGLHWQRALVGDALLDMPVRDPVDVHRRVGSLLAALHQAPVQIARTESAVAARMRLPELHETLSQIDAAWGPALDRLTRALGPALAGLFDGAKVTLHGDLHPRNVLVAPDGRLGLVDLDSLRRGPALLDLGAWAADALYRTHLGGGSIETSVGLLRELLRGYRHAGGSAPNEADLAVATAWQMLNQRAWRCAVNLKPGRYALVRPLLETAQLLLATRSLNAAPHARKAAA